MTAMQRRALGMLGIPASVCDRWASEQPARLTAAAPADNEVLVYGPIVDGLEAAWLTEWFGENVVTSNPLFRERLNAVTGDVVVRIDSPGGDVWAASGIMTAITERRNAGAAVDIVVDGLAASAASLVMLAGGTIKVAPMASLMIHQASGLMYGTAGDFREMADFLDRIDNQAASLYAARMDKTVDEVMAELKAETWFTGPEAVEAGLADEVIALQEAGDDGDKKAADIFARRNLRLAALAGAA